MAEARWFESIGDIGNDGRLRAIGPNERDHVEPAFLVEEIVTPEELEGRRGKLRIQLKSPSASDLVCLSRSLWKTVS